MFIWLNNLKLQNKFIMAFLVFIIIAMLGLGWSIFSMRKMGVETQDIVSEAEELITLEEIQVDLLVQELQEKDFLLTGDKTYLEKHLIFEQMTNEQIDKALKLAATEEEKQVIQALLNKKDGYKKTFDNVVTAYEEGDVEEAIRLSLQVSDVEIEQVHNQIDALVHAGEILIEKEGDQAKTQAQLAMNINIIGLALAVFLGLGIGFFLARSINQPLNLIVKGSKLLAIGDTALTGIDQAEMNKISARGDELGDIGRAFSAIATYMLEMSEVAGCMARGDLSVEVTPQSDQDVLGNAFAQMIIDLRTLINQVQQSAVRVATAGEQLNTMAALVADVSQQVASTIQQVAQGNSEQTQLLIEANSSVEHIANAAGGIARGAQEQALAVQNTSDLINEMAVLVDQVGDVTSSVIRASTKVNDAARHGVTAVEQSSQGMDIIRRRTLNATNKVKEMNVRSKEIGRIVETIDNIADKTDMLALNAAVEAARAGEHGRGFAVVADQVRKLSEDSKEATRDIDQLIERVQETINEAIRAMEGVVTEVDNGNRLAGDTTQSLQEILQAAEESAAMTERINQAAGELRQMSEGVVSTSSTVSAVVEENTAVSKEMASNSQEVTTIVANVASVAEENTAAAEQVSASAEEMSAQIEEVVASVEEVSALAEQLHIATAQFIVTEERVG